MTVRDRLCRLLRVSVAMLGTAAIFAVACPPAGARDAEPDSPTSQDWEVAQANLCEAAIREAEQRHHLPTGLLASIARVESGRPVGATRDLRPWPWVINADGQGLFLDSKAAAVVWVTQQALRHKYIDIGCLQIDLKFHPDAFISTEQAFDPPANADFAARYLLGLYEGEAKRDWNVAVGLYHSHTALRAADYRDRVSEIGARVLRGVLDPVPLYVRAIRHGTLRVPLGTGRSTPINVQRQPALHRRRPTSCQIARILGPYLNSTSQAACHRQQPTDTGRQ